MFRSIPSLSILPLVSILCILIITGCGDTTSTSDLHALPQHSLTTDNQCHSSTEETQYHQHTTGVYILVYDRSRDIHCLRHKNSLHHSGNTASHQNQSLQIAVEKPLSSQHAPRHTLIGSAITGISLATSTANKHMLPVTSLYRAFETWGKTLSRKVWLTIAGIGVVSGYVFMKKHTTKNHVFSSTASLGSSAQNKKKKSSSNHLSKSPNNDPSPLVPITSALAEEDKESFYEIFESQIDDSFLTHSAKQEDLSHTPAQERTSLKNLEKELMIQPHYELVSQLKDIQHFHSPLLHHKEIHFLKAEDIRLFLRTLSLQEFDYSLTGRLQATILKHIFLDRVLGLRNTPTSEIITQYLQPIHHNDTQLYKSSELALKKRFKNFVSALLILKGYYQLDHHTSIKHLYVQFDNIVEVGNMLKTLQHPLTTSITGEHVSIHKIDFDLYKNFFTSHNYKSIVKKHLKGLKVALPIDAKKQEQFLHNIFFSKVFQIQNISTRKLANKYDLIHTGFLVPAISKNLTKKLKTFKTTHHHETRLLSTSKE